MSTFPMMLFMEVGANWSTHKRVSEDPGRGALALLLLLEELLEEVLLAEREDDEDEEEDDDEADDAEDEAFGTDEEEEEEEDCTGAAAATAATVDEEVGGRAGTDAAVAFSTSAINSASVRICTGGFCFPYATSTQKGKLRPNKDACEEALKTLLYVEWNQRRDESKFRFTLNGTTKQGKQSNAMQCKVYTAHLAR